MSIFTEAKKVLDDLSSADVTKRNFPAFLKRESSYIDVERAERLKAEGATILTVCRSYFYRNQVPAGFAQSALTVLRAKFPMAEIIATGDHWAAFCGGANSGTARDSFLYAVISIPSEGGVR